MSDIPASKKIVQYGLSEVYSSSNPKVDIVFVHGLNGHPHHTWATHKPEIFWPADLLPSALEEQHVRILTYGYDANVGVFTDGASKDKIHNHAEHLASRLTANRALKKATERPIIFVCHSLGGLVVKRCLIYAKSLRHSHTERLRSIYVSTYGILFLGTPHNGSDLAKWGTLLQSICAAVLPKKFFDTSPQLVEALKTNNETLQNINRFFIEIIGRYRVYFFHESKPTDLKGTRVFIVDEESAAPVIEGVERMGIERDHSHMCKFEDDSAPGYDVVAEAIQRYAEEAAATISKRWVEEKRIRDVERREAAEEILGGTLLQMTDSSGNGSTGVPQGSNTARISQAASLGGPPKSLEGSSVHALRQIEALPLDNLGVPLLIAPLGFRQNSLFYGFQIELDQLHQRLSNQKKRSIGSCAVVLWGPPGSGKTHLAREYLWRHRDEFPSGIFWVDCKSEESIYKSFWEIGQAAALLSARDVLERDRDWNGATTFLEAVRKWFVSRVGWLIVFDGVTFDSEDEILAFMKFIPDSKGNSIIFTSVDRTLAKRQRLLYPAGIKVSPLSVDDARRLLYKGLDIKNPTPAQETKATELVKYFECLPLAIHAMGHVLTTKGKALEKYHIGSYPTSKRLAEPYAEIMQDLWEKSHHEAVSLINLLSFFSHAVPVAMLQLGRRALNDFNIEIRSIDREGSTRRDLDTTIATLIRYGMVERTLRSYNVERTDSLKSQPSQITGGDSSPELTQDSVREDVLPKRPESSLESSSTRSITCSIDILRVHTVVQGFCLDELKFIDKERYWWWLIAAAKLFCRSYSVADERIRLADGQGLVRDYREYETHAARLYSHFPKDKRTASKNLQKARHELRQVIRAIKHEIETRSPSQSFQSARHQVQISIFERTSSTSSDGPDTPVSNPSRSSTWTIEGLESKSESPIKIEYEHQELIYETVDSGEESSPVDHGYESGFDDSLRSSIVTERRRSIPEILRVSSTGDLERPHEGLSSRRSSFLQAIFKGHPVKPKHKDLGDWRPVPAPPSLTHADIKTTASSRASSSDEYRSISAGSQAEAALATVHRFSPPSSRGGRIRSPSRPATSEAQGKENMRQPLAVRSPNLAPSPLAAEFDVHQTNYPGKSEPSTRHHSRNPTTSPPFRQILPVQAPNLTDKDLPSLPMEENISITRRIPPFDMQPALPVTANYNLTHSDILPMSPPYLPEGYTSQPMSRDASRESKNSLATAPAAPSATSLSPPAMYSYIHRAAPRSADPLASSYPNSNNHLSRIGDWAGQPGPSNARRPLLPAISLSFSGPALVQFGSASPVDLVEARIRADEYARRLMPFERGDFRPNRNENTRPSTNAGAHASSRDDDRMNAREGELHGLGLELK